MAGLGILRNRLKEVVSGKSKRHNKNKEKKKFGPALKGENRWRTQREKAKSGYLGIPRSLGSSECVAGAG